VSQPEYASPSLEVWKDLYEAAAQFKRIESWNWLDDSSTFGVQDPVTKTIAYCSVMGALGELYGLAAYVGTEGLLALQKMAFGETDYSDINLGKDMRCLMTTFESRNDLDKPDIEVIRQLGLSFRGKHNWPRFRSYEPGFFPWYLDAHEAMFVTTILQQAVDVCLRAKDDPDLIPNWDDEVYLVRVAEEKDGELVWEDRMLSPELLPEPELEDSVHIDELQLMKIRNSAKTTDAVWDADLFYAPACVQEDPKSRPYYPLMSLWVDHGTGLIIGTKMAGHDDYRQAFVDELINMVNQDNVKPREIRVKREDAYRLYEGVASKLGIPMRKVQSLGMLEGIQADLAEFLMRR
jgi:hypothetical protein